MPGRGTPLALPAASPLRVLSGDVSWRDTQGCGERWTSQADQRRWEASAVDGTECDIHGHRA